MLTEEQTLELLARNHRKYERKLRIEYLENLLEETKQTLRKELEKANAD